MGDEITALLGRVHSLLDAPLDGTPTARASIEHTLTEGYALALGLEAERLRLEQRIAELSETVEEDETRVSELAALARRRSSTDGDLSRLRSALGTLRERLAAASSAHASARRGNNVSPARPLLQE
ncbi:MAG: hypothetical protein ABR583_12880 [Gaiellaceae bacterium]